MPVTIKTANLKYKNSQGQYVGVNTVGDDPGPIQDVQVNGASITSEGVANVPVANGSTFGVVKVGDGGLGISTNSNGLLRTLQAYTLHAKGGTDSYRPITPEIQHASAFYGIAKAAGVDMASSSNSVGTYTDEAKIAIQKMLGIYQAPWELIREDTFTNATREHYTISVDGNGQPFELTSIRILLDIPTQDTESEMYGGYVIPIDSEGGVTQIVVDTITLSANSLEKVAIAGLEQNAGMYIKWSSPFYTSGNLGRIAVKNLYDATGQPIPFYCGAEKVFTSIRLANVKGTMNYRLFGRRKWT